MNYSGYESEDWPARTLSIHHRECIKHLNAATIAEKESIGLVERYTSKVNEAAVTMLAGDEVVLMLCGMYGFNF